MPTVLIPTAYRGPTSGASEIAVTGSTVRACLKDADRQHSGFLPLVLDHAGVLHRFVKIFVNEVQLDANRALDAELSELDRVEVLAAIAGG
jgi:molybdopterin synthase sulfur carrier subunit